MTSISSRQRILEALAHRETDRVPVDFSGHRSSGIAAIAYHKLRRYLGLPERPIRVYDPVQQLAVVDDDVLDLFGVDTVELGRGFALDDGDWTDWTLPDGTACLMPKWAAPEREDGGWLIRSASGRVVGKMPDGALYFEQCYYSLADQPEQYSLEDALQENLWSVAASPPGPLVDGPGGRERMREGARRLRKSTDRAIIGLFGGNLVEQGQGLFRHDNFFMMLAAEPQQAHRFLDLSVERHLASLERYLADVGDCIDVIVFGDDMGAQTGPQFSPRMYREFFKSRHAALWGRAKQLADVKVMLHCCGGVRELLPDMIEAGLDAINPVQTSCTGMEPEGLKRDFGADLTLWGGGCDTRDVLPGASPVEVAAHVRSRIEILSPGGGFVFQQVHNVLADVPPENVAAMFGAVNQSRISA
ncbi:MAG TPA: uroporphyrinogen decarboxylase family protein [Candidatus Glassbacteria bacterium]|nr:uroporphyrinogen decarboxylase family protein [Candidatus Glassbacteria bacterium]